MASIVVLGAALGGLQTALLLAADGHQVTVLERDPHPPPSDPDVAWARWQRPASAAAPHPPPPRPLASAG
ncbi:NAD(P)-binding protein [Streptomyces sp. MS1.AVA.1]|uniref:NAD(P)-binding protein n=1 Tax=Streptomyces machairae TaxID=3134109 RepID=A0ABU8UHC5_9ACTN